MNRATKITLIVLSVFIVGITMAAISAEPEPLNLSDL